SSWPSYPSLWCWRRRVTRRIQLQDLDLSLSFDKFEVDVQQTLDVGRYVGIQDDSSFLVYGAHRGQVSPLLRGLRGWVLLISLSKTCLLTAYSTSYKGFKYHFVKVRAVSEALFTIDHRLIPLH
ncbi:hypothetical protein CR513_43809, partial [Mucuna pruriens]